MAAESPATGKPPRRLADALALDLLLAVAAVALLSMLGTAAFLLHQINQNFDDELVESAHRLMDVTMHQVERDLEPNLPHRPPHAASSAPLGKPSNAASPSAGSASLPHSSDSAHSNPAASASAAPSTHRAPSQPLLSEPPLFRDDDLVFQLVDAQGQLWLRTQTAPTAVFEVPRQEGFHELAGWRIYVAKHPAQDLYLLLADPLAERSDAVITASGWLAVLWALVLAVLAVLLVGLARRRLGVLERVQHAISTRSGSQLGALSTEGLPAELAALTRDVNALLARLSEALQVERALAANAAHELRTPLAAAQLRLSTALGEGVANPHVAAAHAALNTLQHRTEKLLQLSRAESAHALNLQAVNLNTLAEQVAQEAWDTWPAAQRQLDLELADDPAPMALAEPDALAIALRNLIENALRYAPHADITLAVQAPATVLVRDTGPGVPPERLASLRERHVRASADRTGFGLGLSIVTSVADKHGAQLILQSPPSAPTNSPTHAPTNALANASAASPEAAQASPQPNVPPNAPTPPPKAAHGFEAKLVLQVATPSTSAEPHH